jgi:hypothetical protein
MSEAKTPFRFTGCVELIQNLGMRADDERELIEVLADVPTGSVYHHTFGYFLNRFLATPYGNDFATWAVVHVRDRVLGERLAVVDPFEFADLEQLREELISIVDDHLSRLSVVPRVEYGEPFYFLQSHVVQVPTGQEARTLAEFRTCLAEVDASALYFHMVEARGRRGRRSGDFGEWLRDSLGLTELAQKVERIDLYASGLERVRARALSLVDAAIEEQAIEDPEPRQT